MVILNHQVDEAFQIKALLKAHFHLKDADIGKQSDIISDSTVVIITLLLIGCSTIMGVTTKMQGDALLRKDLESDKVSAELAFLKAQINPHFLFNTLNSIFVLTAGNDQAHQAVYNLSKMMRYVLYETEGKQTTLHKEIVFLEEYLSLMRLRLNDNIKVTFGVQDALPDANVAPMLFLPLIENAFKHGISGTAYSAISFDLQQTGNAITFTTTNQLFASQPTLSEESSGIGLTNTRRRLELLYPGKYTLKAMPDLATQQFTVILKLDVS
jgi:LytS/YehU family sensor histidine kinase